ncbi:hypothetical protein Tco_0264488 [Tanacetum coccineum]
MDFPKFYKELEAEFLEASAKLMGLQLLQLELRLGKTPSRITPHTTNLQIHLGDPLLSHSTKGKDKNWMAQIDWLGEQD